MCGLGGRVKFPRIGQGGQADGLGGRDRGALGLLFVAISETGPGGQGARLICSVVLPN